MGKILDPPRQEVLNGNRSAGTRTFLLVSRPEADPHEFETLTVPTSRERGAKRINLVSVMLIASDSKLTTVNQDVSSEVAVAEGSRKLTVDRSVGIRPRQGSVYLVLPEVVDGEVPQHISCDCSVEGVQDHTPEDEKPGRGAGSVSASDEGCHARGVGPGGHTW